MQWKVYLLTCADGTFYAGVALDLEKRINAHNAGKGAKYTRGRGPVMLVYAEEAISRSEAQKREAELKKLTPAKKRELAESWKPWSYPMSRN